jgi:hypothetical protein
MAGVGQLLIVGISLAVPRVLRWSAETAKLRPILRQLFWVYGGYILAFNLSFGLLATLAPHWLLDGTPLAAAVTSFITLYWTGRLCLQFVFDRGDFPRGTQYQIAEVVMIGIFSFVAVTFAWATGSNLGWLY